MPVRGLLREQDYIAINTARRAHCLLEESRRKSVLSAIRDADEPGGGRRKFRTRCFHFARLGNHLQQIRSGIG